MHGLPSPAVESVHGYVLFPVTVTVPPPRSVARAAQWAPDVVMLTAPVADDVIVPAYVAYSPREESFVVVIVSPSLTAMEAPSQLNTAFAYFAAVLTLQLSSVIVLPLPTATTAE